MAKTPLATNQKAAPIEVEPAACAGEQGSLQFLPVLTEAKLTSCEAKQVPCESNTAQGKQVWRAKREASPREALGKVETQLRLSREDKGKTSLSFGSVAYASREAEVEPQRREFLLASSNPKELFSSTKFAPRSEVKGASLSADSVAYTASASKGASNVPSHEAGTKALGGAKYLRRNAKNKALLRAIPSCAKSEVRRLHSQSLLALSPHLAADLQA